MRVVPPRVCDHEIPPIISPRGLARRRADPASRDSLSEAGLSRLGGGLRERRRRNLKKLYAELAEPRGWGWPGSSRIEGREMGEAARGPTEKNWQDSKGWAGSPQKRQVEGTHSPGTASKHDGHKRMDRRTPWYGSPCKSMQPYPRK